MVQFVFTNHPILSDNMAAPFPTPTKTWHTKSYPAIDPTRPELSAKGKTVVVTGGGTGIGAETARYFAKAGASKIGILGRREQPLLETKARIEKEFPNVEVIAASADITKKSDVDAAFAKVVGDGKIHVLISNAGLMGPLVPIKDVNGDEFVGAIESNIRGAFNVAQAFLRYAVEDAHVVETSSSSAHVDFGPGLASYSTSKMAKVRFWNALAFENPSISVFHTQPGVIDTAMNREVGGIEALGFEDDSKFKPNFLTTHRNANLI